MPRSSPFEHLRPTTTPEMLDRAYSVSARFWIFLWGAGVVAGADHLLALVMIYRGNVPMSDPTRVATTLGLSLAGDFAAACALLGVFQGLIFPLRPVSPRAIFRTAVRKFPGYFLTHLAYVIVVAFFGLMGLRTYRSGSGTEVFEQNAVIGVGLMLMALLLGVRLCLAAIACLIEDGNPVAAMRRSWHLTASWPRGWSLRKDRPVGRLVAVALLPLLAAGLVLVAGLMMGVYGLGLPWPSAQNGRATAMMMELIGFFATAVAMPLLWAGLMATYIEYRMRTEALDFYLRLRELSREMPGEYPL